MKGGHRLPFVSFLLFDMVFVIRLILPDLLVFVGCCIIDCLPGFLYI